MYLGDSAGLPMVYDNVKDEVKYVVNNNRWNVAPSAMMPIIVDEGAPHIEIAKWGLVPFWESHEAGAMHIINARADSVATKPAFKKAFQLQRCLVPASGFFEWHSSEKEKVPYFIHLKHRRHFSFAGLYEETENKDGDKLKTYTIITCEPNILMKKIHNRMPVILRKEDESRWLNHKETDTHVLQSYLKPYDAHDMEAWIVSHTVNNPRNDVKEIIEKVLDKK